MAEGDEVMDRRNFLQFHKRGSREQRLHRVRWIAWAVGRVPRATAKVLNGPGW